MKATGRQDYRWGIFLARLGSGEGSGQSGTRPVLVISEEDFNRVMPVVTVLPLTTLKPGRKVYPNEALFPKGVCGMSNASLVLAHQIRTISKDRLFRLSGTLRDDLLRNRVLNALKVHLAIS